MFKDDSIRAGRMSVIAIAAVLAFALAWLAAPASAQADEGSGSLTASALTAQADDDDIDYFASFAGVPYSGDYGFYFMPGNKATITAKVAYFDQANDWKKTYVKGATATWLNVDKRLKAKIDGNKLIIKKMPKAGTYKFKVVIRDKDGNKLISETRKIVVKKKIPAKLKMDVMSGYDDAGQNVKWAYVGSRFVMTMDGASFGWDNNTKKPFYVWKVEDVDTGEVAVWNKKKGVFKKNSFIESESVAGGACPNIFGKFKKTGTFKFTGVVYRSNKKVATVTKTVTAW